MHMSFKLPQPFLSLKFSKLSFHFFVFWPCFKEIVCGSKFDKMRIIIIIVINFFFLNLQHIYIIVRAFNVYKWFHVISGQSRFQL